LIGPYRLSNIIKTNDVSLKYGRVSVPFQVDEIFLEPDGKTGSEDFIFVDYSSFLSHLSVFIQPEYNQTIRNDLQNVDLYDYSEKVFFNFPRVDRIEEYNDNDFDVVQGNIIKFTSKIMYLIGYDQVESSHPILSFMFQTRFFSLFLGNFYFH
jgi:hypothetical protein